MDYRQLAKLIPSNVRTQRLMTEADPITNAVPVQTNYHMNLLFEIYFTFIDPTGTRKLNCPVCLQNILDNFRQMKAALVELEHEANLLKAIKL